MPQPSSNMSFTSISNKHMDTIPAMSLGSCPDPATVMHLTAASAPYPVPFPAL